MAKTFWLWQLFKRYIIKFQFTQKISAAEKLQQERFWRWAVERSRYIRRLSNLFSVSDLHQHTGNPSSVERVYTHTHTHTHKHTHRYSSLPSLPEGHTPTHSVQNLNPAIIKFCFCFLWFFTEKQRNNQTSASLCLSDRIAQNRKTIVCPMIDVIDHDNFGYDTQAGDAMRGAFDWEMYYKRIPIPPELQGENPIEPFEWVTRHFYCTKLKDESALWRVDFFSMKRRLTFTLFVFNVNFRVQRFFFNSLIKSCIFVLDKTERHAKTPSWV